ncbi:MAG TPA: FecR domain-containing protein [Longimicrobium sp.]|jgi:transmembrane sensor|uniref:FecR family protein n=1 Tax=Longimicrobium sp. TaxID=2029185 RepID=UPI002ED8DD08
MQGDIDWEVLGRYLAGESPAEERAAVRRRVLHDPEFRQLVDTLGGAGRPAAAYDVDAAWARVQARTGSDTRSPAGEGRFGRAPLPGRAARSWPVLRAAAVAALLLGGAALAARITGGGPPPAPAMREAVASRGQLVTVRLADGSEVMLAPESRLRYPAAFGGTREVHLRGEALFRVARRPDRPFRVHAGAAVVEVLGTVFDVSARPGARVDVAVAEGRVRLGPAGGARAAGVVLARGELGRLDPDSGLSVARGADVGAYIGWTHRRMVFSGTQLGDVAAAIERWYDVRVEVHPALRRRRVTMSIADASLSEVLNAISAALNVQHQVKGGVVTISRPPEGS